MRRRRGEEGRRGRTQRSVSWGEASGGLLERAVLSMRGWAGRVGGGFDWGTSTIEGLGWGGVWWGGGGGGGVGGGFDGGTSTIGGRGWGRTEAEIRGGELWARGGVVRGVLGGTPSTTGEDACATRRRGGRSVLGRFSS